MPNDSGLNNVQKDLDESKITQIYLKNFSAVLVKTQVSKNGYKIVKVCITLLRNSGGLLCHRLNLNNLKARSISRRFFARFFEFDLHRLHRHFWA